MKKVAAGIAILTALILLYLAFSSERDAALNAGERVNDSWQRANDNRYMAELDAENRDRILNEKIEAISGVAFLIIGLVLFNSSKKSN